MTALLDVQELVTCIRNDDQVHTVVDGVSFDIAAGETLGLVGESGSGKSMTALSVMGLLPQPDVELAGGAVRFGGRDLSRLSRRELAALRGRDISMIFQDPMTALNPVHRIGAQIVEVLRLHQRGGKGKGKDQEFKRRAVELLRAVGLPEPAKRMDAYPHELSGGQRQRVMIAIALAGEPQLLIADEPTTALDVTVQAQILKLIKDLQAERGTAMLFITHDLALVSQLCDRVAVMYAGQIVESAPASELFKQPLHPYTHALLASTPGANTGHKQNLHSIPGTVIKPEDYGSRCRFRNRCAFANAECESHPAPLERASADREVRCLRWRDLTLGGEHG